MNRPTWNNTYMNMCDILAQRSTCCRIQTASIIVKDNIIISVGYNGVVSGQEHCIDYWQIEYDILKRRTRLEDSFDEFLNGEYFSSAHHELSNKNEIHGEMNAILFAGKNGIPLQDSTLYTIYSPCIHCAKSIYTSGIKKVVYKKVYHRSIEGLEFLRDRGIEIEIV